MRRRTYDAGALAIVGGAREVFGVVFGVSRRHLPEVGTAEPAAERLAVDSANLVEGGWGPSIGGSCLLR